MKTGVEDTTTGRFEPCGYTGHYDAIRKILEEDHPELWKIFEDYCNKKRKECDIVDEFILEKLILHDCEFNKDKEWN